ncbi:MAG: hypothetical protein COB46_13510 [Rhodospirillaceae bacterium]|nr:MAG: hypothetical protein COB46_13510 [Rhodospirillaceae bacterium]
MKIRFLSGVALPLFAVPVVVYAGDVSGDLLSLDLSAQPRLAQTQSPALSLSPDGRLNMNVDGQSAGNYQFSFSHPSLAQTDNPQTQANDTNSGDWQAELNATNADNTDQFGIQFERHLKNGVSGAVTYKTLIDENQGVGGKIKWGQDTRALFGQYLRALPKSLDENGSVAMTLGYQQFDRTDTFNGEVKSDTLDAYLASLRYTHDNANSNSIWSRAYGETSYVNMNGPSFIVSGSDAGYPDMVEYRGEFGVATRPANGVELTPFVGMERTRTSHVDNTTTTRNKTLTGLETAVTWNTVMGTDNNFGTTRFKGERNTNSEWDASLSHTYDKWSVSARNNQTHDWSVTFGYNFTFDTPNPNVPNAETAMNMSGMRGMANVLNARQGDTSTQTAQNTPANINMARINLSNIDFSNTERMISTVADVASASALVACVDTAGSPSQTAENLANIITFGQTTTASITFSETVKSVDYVEILNLGGNSAGGTISTSLSGVTVNLNVTLPNVSPVKIRITVSDCAGNQVTHDTAWRVLN